MASQTPLHGLELVACAKANAKYGIVSAAEQCGYGADTDAFESSLKRACDEAGITIEQLSDLLTAQELGRNRGAVEISPNTLDDDL